MKSLWILGYGPLLVDTQFCSDYQRVIMTFDGAPMPADMREGVRLIYDTVGRNYYVYTKFMNQTLGNFGFMRVKGIQSCPHIIVDMPTYRVHGFSKDQRVQCTFCCHGFDSNLKKQTTYHVKVTLDLQKYIFTVGCRVYKHSVALNSNVEDAV